jgi:predicted acetyltransferase
VADDSVVESAFKAWHGEVAFAEKFVAAASSLDIVGKDEHRGEISLRWVLVHMIEEYARHLGHADLLREAIDGATGQ